MDRASRAFSYKISQPLSQLSALRDEAKSKKHLAQKVFHTETTLDDDNHLSSPISALVSGPGSALQDFQRGTGRDLALALVGDNTQLIFPTRSSYIFYSEDDFNLIHHDVVHANITVLITLEGRPEPLTMYPHLGSVSSDDLQNLRISQHIDRTSFEAQASSLLGDRMLGYELQLECNRAVAIAGQNVAHAHFRQTSASLVATVCYALLTPSPEWLAPQPR
jgi:hypothetical protein